MFACRYLKMTIDLFKTEKEPKKGLMAFEWVVLAYIAFTLIIMMFTSTKIVNPQAMLWERIRALIIILALWGVYRAIPCKFTRLVRVVVQLVMLGLWYPDTYEINRMFVNQDHLVAMWDQKLFGCQPALEFCKLMPWHWLSELFDMGYFAYYPMIGLVAIYYFGWRYREFERASFVILATFFIYYVIFILFPVVGPTFYYHAVGVDEIAKGVFPEMNDYFSHHTDCLPSPGYTKGIFYNLVEDAKATGERPTAAFPSSHIGVSTVLLLLVWHAKNYKLLFVLLPFYVFLCCATVYIQAHYLVDAFAGLISAVILYYFLMFVSKGLINEEQKESKPKARKKTK